MKKIKHKPVSSKTEKKQVSLLPEFLKEQRTRILLGIALALVSLYILFALIGFFFSGGIDQSLVDGPWGKIITNPEIEVSNPAGKIGAWISDLLINRWFGISSFILLQFPSGEYQSKKLQPQVIHRYVYYSLDLFIPGFSLGEYFQSFRSRHRLPIPGGRPWTFCQRLVELIGRTYRDYADSDPHFYRHSVFRIRTDFL